MDNDATREQPASSRSSEMLLGREAELRILAEKLDGIGEGGAALLIRGDPGVGKTAILAAGKRLGIERGVSALSAAGVQSETNLSFAGLFELVRPILDRIERLPESQQNALRA